MMENTCPLVGEGKVKTDMNQENTIGTERMVTGEQGKAPIATRYSVVLADPPWRYEFSKSRSRKIENHYPTMSTGEICALNIPSAENAVLYLWATAPKLVDALRVMGAWGFSYRTNIIWDKVKMGCGHWARIQHELLLVGVKGTFSPPCTHLRVRSVISIPRSKHSSKPSEIRNLIARWYPNERKLEMFARERAENWDSWGNEVECDVAISMGTAADTAWISKDAHAVTSLEHTENPCPLVGVGTESDGTVQATAAEPDSAKQQEGADE